MKPLDVILVSATELSDPDVDDQPLRQALAAAGLRADTLAWDDPDVDWSAARICLLRSTWNYVQHHAAFLAWTERCAAATALWNPPAVVRWNSHKGYLVELAASGLPVVPTRMVNRGDSADVAAIFRRWPQIVIKPAIGAGSLDTIRADITTLQAAITHLARLAATGDVLIQPYLRSVADYGERSLIWIDGRLTHAVRKSARFSGDAEGITAAPIADDEAMLAEQILAAAPAPTLYARIDLARDDAGQPRLMEVELIEPSLFFEHGSGGLARLVDALLRLIASGVSTSGAIRR